MSLNTDTSAEPGPQTENMGLFCCFTVGKTVVNSVAVQLSVNYAPVQVHPKSAFVISFPCGNTFLIIISMCSSIYLIGYFLVVLIYLRCLKRGTIPLFSLQGSGFCAKILKIFWKKHILK